MPPRKDGKPFVKKPVRYLMFPAGHIWRHRPLPGAPRSHVGITIIRQDVPATQARDFRRTLCGMTFRRETTASRRWDWKRYHYKEKIEWDRVTCDSCRRFIGTWK